MIVKQLCAIALGLALQDASIPVRETPRYSNRGERVDQYQTTAGVTPPEPYCASALYTWFQEASVLLECGNPLKRTGYCPDAVDHLKRTKRGRKRPTDARPGDAIFYWVSKEGRFGHTGIVLKNNGDGTVMVVEANTNTDGAVDGDGVYIKHRNVAGTRHFVADLQHVFSGELHSHSVDPLNVTRMIPSQLPAAKPVRVTLNGFPVDIPAHSYLDRTYVAIAPYAQVMQGKELAYGAFDGHTSSLNLVTK